MGMNALRRRYSRSRGYLGPEHRYAIYGIPPKRTRRGNIAEGYLKERHLVGKGRDAQEAATEMWRLRHLGYNRGWMYIVVDRHAGRGKLAPVITYEELLARAK